MDYGIRVKHFMLFRMAVGAKHHAFRQFDLDLFPRPGNTTVTNIEVLLRGVNVVKLEGRDAAVISTFFTFTTLKFNRHHLQLTASSGYSVTGTFITTESLAAITIGVFGFAVCWTRSCFCSHILN